MDPSTQYWNLEKKLGQSNQLTIDHVHFYVDDAGKWREWFVEVMGFQEIASGCDGNTQTEVVRSGEVTFVLSSPLTSNSFVAQFLQLHPPGVADVAFGVADIEVVQKRAITQGAKILQPLQQWQSVSGEIKWTQIASITSLKHTLMERSGITPPLPQSWLVQKSSDLSLNPAQLNNNYSDHGVNFTGIDHIVLNVALGDLEKTVSWYETSLGFQRKQTFNIQTNRSGLYSQVLVHPESGVQFPVNEPRSANSQIQEFLDFNRGSGIQHLALKTPQITEVVRRLRSAGLSFLSVPSTYYTQLQEKHPNLELSAEEWAEIKAQEILVDYQEKRNLEIAAIPLLLQIFTQPIFGQPTFFFELIERRFQAKGFGRGNFRTLFEAIEREQIQRGSLE